MRVFGVEITRNARIINGNRKELRETDKDAIVALQEEGIPRKELAATFPYISLDTGATMMTRTEIGDDNPTR